MTDLAICSLIGGFFFLRFINPAIVTPQAYMLVDGVPAKHPRRTLTLIAKMLQNLANKPSYSKEAYMMSLNPFVDANKGRINQFLNDLCEVGDFYDTLEVSSPFLQCLWVRGLTCTFAARPVYGAVQEGSLDKHHAQRAI